MKKKFYGVFQSIDDAKEALGRIKKESLNLVDLTVIYLEPHQTKKEGEELHFETAVEDFVENNRLDVLKWPGLHQLELEGFGKINIGMSNSRNAAEKKLFDRKAFEAVEPEIENHKIVALIEVEPHVAGKVRYVLESIGADIIED